MGYIELKISTDDTFAEILMAELGEIGFESFTEEDYGLNAYIQEALFDQLALDEIWSRYQGTFKWQLSQNNIAKQNWNATWEQNYEPIYVADQVQVRASFHEAQPQYRYDIVINPKMSFGTGHHETTSMMMEHQLELDFNNKAVLDVGCGTAILAILAEKQGASQLAAFDIEEWAAENSAENVALNYCKHIAVRQGTIEQEPHALYDIILANINRNILLRDVSEYIKFMKKGSVLLVSGFYQSDLSDIEAKFKTFGLEKAAQKTKNNWASAKFILA